MYLALIHDDSIPQGLLRVNPCRERSSLFFNDVMTGDSPPNRGFDEEQRSDMARGVVDGVV